MCKQYLLKPNIFNLYYMGKPRKSGDFLSLLFSFLGGKRKWLE